MSEEGEQPRSRASPGDYTVVFSGDAGQAHNVTLKLHIIRMRANLSVNLLVAWCDYMSAVYGKCLFDFFLFFHRRSCSTGLTKASQ